MNNVFIGGAQRSGTTLLQLVLCQGAESNPMPGEANYLRLLLKNYRDCARTREIQSYFENSAAFQSFHRSVIAAFLDQAHRHLGSPDTLVLKDPYFACFSEDLLNFVPESRFLCVVRDPRDTIASMLEVSERSEKLYRKRLFPDDLSALSRHFLSFYTQLLSSKIVANTDRVMFLRYEDLVLQPEDQFKRLQQFTGVALDKVNPDHSFSSGLVDYASDESVSPWWSKHYGQKVSQTSVGRYRERFSLEQIQVITSQCADFIQRFGYEATAYV
jgi:hypothetical protein